MKLFLLYVLVILPVCNVFGMEVNSKMQVLEGAEVLEGPEGGLAAKLMAKSDQALEAKAKLMAIPHLFNPKNVQISWTDRTGTRFDERYPNLLHFYIYLSKSIYYCHKYKYGSSIFMAVIYCHKYISNV